MHEFHMSLIYILNILYEIFYYQFRSFYQIVYIRKIGILKSLPFLRTNKDMVGGITSVILPVI